MMKILKNLVWVVMVTLVLSSCSYTKGTKLRDGTPISYTVLILSEDYTIHFEPSAYYSRSSSRSITFKKGYYYPTNRIARTLTGSKEASYIANKSALYLKESDTKKVEYTGVITVNIKDRNKSTRVARWVQGYGPDWYPSKIPDNLIKVVKQQDL